MREVLLDIREMFGFTPDMRREGFRLTCAEVTLPEVTRNAGLILVGT